MGLGLYCTPLLSLGQEEMKLENLCLVEYSEPGSDRRAVSDT
jgi:hypothetical protein